MKTISVPVPDWFPTKKQLSGYKRKFLKAIFPPRCVDCNIRVRTSSFYWKQLRAGMHPMGFANTIGIFAIRVNRRSCATCMSKYLHSLPKENGTCTLCTATDVPVLGYTFLKNPTTTVTFLWHWWNGSEFCMKCVDDLLTHGDAATDVYDTVVNDGVRRTVPVYY